MTGLVFGEGQRSQVHTGVHVHPPSVPFSLSVDVVVHVGVLLLLVVLSTADSCLSKCIAASAALAKRIAAVATILLLFLRLSPMGIQVHPPFCGECDACGV